MQEHEKLPTGKSIMRQFDAEGRVVKETHAYGVLEIGITLEFNAGLKTGEMYFVKQRLVSRKRYDTARAEYSDMPPPASDLEDIGGQIAKAAQAERRQFAKAAKEHVPDPALAARTDTFCRSMLENGRRADALEWIKSIKHTLGEFSHTKSRNIVDKLIRAGAKRLYVCEIDQYDENEENSGHLVVELPDSLDDRKAVLHEVDRHASR